MTAAVSLATLGNGPAFSANNPTSQSINANTFTKLQYSGEEFDTNSTYDNTTNYRFTPTVAGYYQVNARIQFFASSYTGSEAFIMIYKNGTGYKRLTSAPQTVSGVSSPGGPVLVYLNGSTDYVEAYVYQANSANAASSLNGSTDLNYFQAFLARGA